MDINKNARKLAKKCDSSKTIWPIVVLSVIVGLCSAFGYAGLVDDVPESASYSGNISIPAGAVLVSDFADITILVREGESNLTYGKGGIPLAPITLNEAEFKAQEFSKYYYTLGQKDTDKFGDKMLAEVDLVIFGVSGKDIYQFSCTYHTGSIVAEENSFSPWSLEKLEPSYDVSNFEVRKTEEIISFTSTFRYDNKDTWWNVVFVSFFAYGAITFVLLIFADLVLLVLLIIVIFIAKDTGKKDEPEG